MAEDVLVSSDVEHGAALVRALDEAGFPVLAAFWLYRPEFDIWKLTIATPRASEALFDAYLAVREIAERSGLLAETDLGRISLVPPTDPTVATLSKSRRTEGVGGLRVTNNMINGVFVEDAYVYRAAA